MCFKPVSVWWTLCGLTTALHLSMHGTAYWKQLSIRSDYCRLISLSSSCIYFAVKCQIFFLNVTQWPAVAIYTACVNTEFIILQRSSLYVQNCWRILVAVDEESAVTLPSGLVDEISMSWEFLFTIRVLSFNYHTMMIMMMTTPRDVTWVCLLSPIAKATELV